MAENPIKYSDLIQPDDSIEKLIGQLKELQQTYDSMAETVKSQAQELIKGLQGVSGATESGRKSTKGATEDAARLERIWKQLEQASSANAQEIAKLTAAKQQMNRYQKAMVDRGKEEITTSQQIAQASYKQLSAQYNLNKAYINGLTVKERNTKENKRLIQSTREMYEQMKKLQAETGKMQLNVGNYTNSLMSATSALGKYTLGIGSAAAAGMAIMGVIKNNVSLARDYEKSISVLAAILNTTTDQIKELTDQAEHLGATTVFTAKEVAELQTELAKLGYSTQDILNMSPSVLNFAQATGASLADAASLTGAALRMFEKDTKHTEEFVDKMSAATTKSALSFSYLNNALSTVSPVANAFGFQIEEVLALLGQLANAGFDASSAATATRNILLNLADSSGNLATALGKPVTNLDELVEGLKKLNDRGIDLAETLDLTDKRSVAAFNTFLSGTDTVINLRDELNNANGAAQQMANTMANNLEGSMKSLSSAWEAFNLHINTSNGLLRGVVDWLTKLVRWLDKAFLSFERFIKLGNMSADEYFEMQLERSGGLVDDAVGGGGSSSGGSGGGSGGSGGSGGGGKKKNKKKGGSTAKQQLREQEKAQKEALALRRAYEDAMIELYDDEYTKERAKTIMHYDRMIEDLKKKEGDQKIINDLSILYEQQKQQKLAEIFDKELKDQYEKEDEMYKAQKAANDKKKREDEKRQKEEEDLQKKRQRAMDEALNYALDNITKLVDAWVQAAERKKQIADEEVDRAYSLLEAEIEARANGYANEVDMARKELEAAKKNQEKALREQQRAQRAQQAIDTAMQVSSLVTATANIWKAFTGGGIWGVAGAIAATALMWGSFAAAKIQAVQATSSGSEEYGEGTVEMLHGGSHQSGNDIDLGRKADGTRRRAEGGEFFAVINKRNSRKFRDLIPDVINSFNDGTFAEKYMGAYGGNVNVAVAGGDDTHLRALSDDVRQIREQGETQCYTDGKGNTVVLYKNVKRITKGS